MSWVMAYLIGSLPAGLFVGYLWTGQDIRMYGSGDCGLKNVFRVISLEAALVTLIAEGLKGLLPVLAAKSLGISGGSVALTGILVIVGSLWTWYPGIRGAFSITTSLGVLTGITPNATGPIAALVISCLLLFRKASWTAWAMIVFLPVIGLLSTANWVELTVIFGIPALMIARELQQIVHWPKLMKDGVTYKVKN